MNKYIFDSNEDVFWKKEGFEWTLYATCYSQHRSVLSEEDGDITAWNLGKPWPKFEQNRVKDYDQGTFFNKENGLNSL